MSESDYGSENQNEEMVDYDAQDRIYLKNIIDEKVNTYIVKLEGDLESTKNKKHKGMTSFKAKEKKEKELKCGKIMWASISFTLYAILYIALILYQLNVERNFWYN